MLIENRTSFKANFVTTPYKVEGFDDLAKETARKAKEYESFKEVVDAQFVRRLQPRSTNVEKFIMEDVRSKRGTEYMPLEVSSRIQRKIQRQEPIDLAVIAVAHKNPNKDISGGRVLPDLSELALINHLNDIVMGISEVHSPGARITVLSEGMFYQMAEPIFDVSSHEIQEYEKNVQTMASEIGAGNISIVPLADILKDTPRYFTEYEQAKRELQEYDYKKYLPVMQRSITEQQVSQGITPEEMARRYVAAHKAKHRAGEGQKSSIYEFLEDNLGPDYIYSSVTGSHRPEVLNIDPMYKSAELPQHGVGVVRGGIGIVDVVPFIELAEQMQQTRFGRVMLRGYDSQPFGFINYGARK